MADDLMAAFRDLANILHTAHTSRNAARLRLRTPAGSRFAAHMDESSSIAEAMLRTLDDDFSNISEPILGNDAPAHIISNDLIIASDYSRVLAITLARRPDMASLQGLAPGTVLLWTDFYKFCLYQIQQDRCLPKPFATYSADEICDEIQFHGSLWQSIFPAHYSLVTRTISYTLPQYESAAMFSAGIDPVRRRVRQLFSKNADLANQEDAAARRLQCLETPDHRLMSLNNFCEYLQTYDRSPKLLTEHLQGSFTLRRYQPERSGLFDFGKPAVLPKRTDYVTTYNVQANQMEYHREFFLLSKSTEEMDIELQRAAFDLLHMLAIRRTKLFRTGFARRVYTVLLPPCLLDEPIEYSKGWAIFPCLTLYRTPQHGAFRRTVSLTLIACPFKYQQQTGLPFARRAPLQDLHELADELKSPFGGAPEQVSSLEFQVRGQLPNYLGLSGSQFTVPRLSYEISRSMLKRLQATPAAHRQERQLDETQDRAIASTLFSAAMESRVATMMLQVDWKSAGTATQPWEQWLATGDDNVFCDALFRVLFYEDYLDPYHGYTSRNAIDLAQLNVGNTLGADMTGMTLYDPHDDIKFIVYPCDVEIYPNYSMMRWLAWQVYIDSALASLQTMIGQFHTSLDDGDDLRAILPNYAEMVRNFIELYDLDIREYFYRREYEKLRALIRIDSDYDELRSQFASAKEDASLREQRLINKLLVVFTFATVTTAATSTLAGIGQWSLSAYTIITATSFAGVVTVGYVMFDRFRRAVERVRQIFSR